MDAATKGFAAAAWGAPYKVVDRWLYAPGNTTFLGEEILGSSLYVREAYDALFDTLEAEKQDGRPHAVVSGNPGVGKSWFALWVLVR